MTQESVNELAYKIVGCAIEVYKELGPGLLESIYEFSLSEELKSQGLQVNTQVAVPIFYKGKEAPAPLKIDLLVEDTVIVELKSVETLLPIFKAQLLTYLKLTQKPKGLLINFNCQNITKEGLIPLVTPLFSQLPKFHHEGH
jgi:GxxExxY protein